MKKDYATILLEEIRDQNKAILEGLREVPKRVEFNELKQDVAEVKQSVKTIEAAVKATNRDLAALKQRVTRLEPA
jgi:septal ring factor EnvC (AmiA/AmiB activator)